MTAEAVLLRLASTFPASFGAWATVGFLVWALRIRAPRVCVALWALAAADTFLALADLNAASIFVARVVVPPDVLSTAVAPWAPYAVAFWCAGSAALFARRVVAVRRLRSAAESLHHLHGAEVHGLPRGVRLVLPPGDGTPFVAGFLRPVVVVPRTFWERLEDDERKAVLEHEAAHVRHRDPLLRFAAESATDLLWPAIPLRWIVRHLAAALEVAADAAAVRHGASRPALARAVLASIDVAVAPRHAWALHGVRGTVARRLDRLRRPGASWLLGLQIGALVLLAPLRPGCGAGVVDGGRETAEPRSILSIGFTGSSLVSALLRAAIDR